MWNVLGTVLCLTILLIILLIARRRLRAKRQYQDEMRLIIARWFDQADDGKHKVVNIPDTSGHRSSDLAEEDLKTGTESR